MNHDEAKFILAAFRPSGAARGDPVCTKALERVQLDPGLGGLVSVANGMRPTGR